MFERKNFESQKVYYWSKRTKRNVRESTDNTRIKIAQNHFGCFLFAADSTMCNPLLAIYLKQCLYTILICYFVVISLLFVWMFQTPAWFLSVQHSYHLGSEEKTHRIRLRTLVDKRWWWSWSRNVCRLKGKGTTEIKMSARRRFQVKKITWNGMNALDMRFAWYLWPHFEPIYQLTFILLHFVLKICRDALIMLKKLCCSLHGKLNEFKTHQGKMGYAQYSFHFF